MSKMALSPHSLHPPVLRTQSQKEAADAALRSIVARRRDLFDFSIGPKDVYQIPLTTISTSGGFDAAIAVQLRGASATSMIVDTGNSCLILPRYEDIAALRSPSPYVVVLTDKEPWGCRANLVRGPIDLVDADGAVFTIEDCIFWACTADNDQGERTANFGAGCLTRWTSAGGQDLSPAQTYTDYAFAEFDFAPAETVLSGDAEVKVSTGSALKISRATPSGFTWFDIVDTDWMALVPRTLSVGSKVTAWPGSSRPAIAMIDTGGTCAYLVDPDDLVISQVWPPMAASNPGWAQPAWKCETTQATFTLEVGDAQQSFTYTVDTTNMPASVRGETLVMCQSNVYMRDQYGLNIGGVSALALDIAVDYGRRRVGLRTKA